MTSISLQQNYSKFDNLLTMTDKERAVSSEDYGQNLANLLTELGCNPYYISSIILSSIHANINGKVFYHTPLHVLDIFYFALTNGIELEPWEQLAIFYHDVIYRPESKNNENNSIQFMLSILSGTGVKQDVLTKAAFGIQATAMHTETYVGKEVEKLLDLDVHSFGYPFERYIENSNNIRSEYVNDDEKFNGITNQKFVSGRIDFLKKFVGKGFVFRTDFFKTNFEDQAKSNIQKEVDMLEQFQKNI